MYLLLGGLAILVGLAVLVWLPDSPVHAKRLSEEEKIAVLERVRDDQGGTENKKIKLDQIKEAVTDVRTWLIVLTTLLSMFAVMPIVEGLTTYAPFLASIPNGALSNCMSHGYASYFFGLC